LYNFQTGTDGSAPVTGLVQGTDGNFYGTTSSDGAHGGGTVFKITPGGTLTTLHGFLTSTEGASPFGTLIQATDGNFYGTTRAGGANSAGTVYRMTPAGALTVLHTFGGIQGKDGGAPFCSLIQATDGNLYGTTSQVATVNFGTVFRITPSGTFTTLYTFSGKADGANPMAGLIQAQDGNFYGTTQSGGAHDFGSIFKITPGGALTSLYSFGATSAGPSGPTVSLIQATDGNFYGSANNPPTIFKMTPSGALTLLVNPDGAVDGPLIQAKDGNFYGTTFAGGRTSDGSVFSLSGPGYVCNNTTPPAITSIHSASAYGNFSYFASGSWLEIIGTNLADPNGPRLANASHSGQWTTSDFSGSNAPTSLDGISVSINGKPAYTWYLSPTQLNVQAPEDSTTGNAAITVINCKATSSITMFSRRSLAAGLLAPPTYSSGSTQYMVATFASDGAYVLNTSLGAAFGFNSRPAKPGDVILAYGVGFGAVTPSILPGVIVQQSNSLVNPVTFSFGATPAMVSYSGLAGSFVGLYEFYITVPSGLADGDYQINVTQNGAAIPQTMYLTVHN
jgi:uncharacterized protein (TIGR03437 family)